jgi:FlaA1/EpsC-like NDP-sugar epimerase
MQSEQSLVAGRCQLEAVVGSVTNRRRLSAIFARYKPDIVFHAAAYKHVPMMEEHPEEAAMVNAVGTYLVAQTCAQAGVERFVLVSTDKAVHPTNVMGASKRLAELAVQVVAQQSGLSACSVRFGNVLGSRGSVIPLFERQIQAGGPVTVTDPEMKRYFMTIPEAAGLIVQAGAFGESYATYVLDMGEEVSILRLAERMIELHGHCPGDDIQIVYTGTRPGEKLREELSFQDEMTSPTDHPKIRLLRQAPLTFNRIMSIDRSLAVLAEHVQEGDPHAVRATLFRAVELADAEGIVKLHDRRQRERVASRLETLNAGPNSTFAQGVGSND